MHKLAALPTSRLMSTACTESKIPEVCKRRGRRQGPPTHAPIPLISKTTNVHFRQTSHVIRGAQPVA